MAIMLYKASNTNFTMNGDYTLQPLSCLATFNLNDTWQLDIDIPDGNEDFKAGAVISVDTPYGKRQLYRIQDTDRDMNDATATAYPIFLDSRNDCFLWDVRPTNKIGQDALDIMLAGSKYTGQSDITTASTAYYVQKNFIEALNGDDENAFLKRWGGEVAYQNFKIIVNNRLGADNGLRVEFGFNLTGLQEQVDMSNVVTRIIPKAFNGYILPDNETVDSPLINNYPVVYTRVIEYQDVKLAEDATEEDEDNGTIICATMEELYAALRTKANAEFDAGIDLPNITYDVDMVDLSRTDLYKDYAGLLNVQLGDTVHVKNRRMGIETTARVITLVYDCITQKVTSLTLGDYEANYFNDVSSAVSTVNGLNEAVGNIYDPNSRTVIAGKISGVINLLQTTLKAQKDIAQRQDVRAILFEDLDQDSDTFGALCIGTQGIQISRQRNETDTDWIWGTAIDFQSINADYIITGILTDRQGNFYLDMNTGDLRMKNGAFVGNITGGSINLANAFTVDSNGNVYISKGSMNINNNFIVDSNGNLTAKGNAKFTGSITGSTISGGTINGTSIITDKDLTIGFNLYMGDIEDRATRRYLLFNDEYGLSFQNDIMTVGLNPQSGLASPAKIYFTKAGAIFVTSNDQVTVASGGYGILLNTSNNAPIKFSASGNITSNKQITVTSDKRLKENIKPIDLSKLIDLIDVKSFNYIGSKQKTVGVIAQDFVGTEFEDIILRKDGKGFYAVDYNVILMALVQYIQEMKGDNNNANIN